MVQNVFEIKKDSKEKIKTLTFRESFLKGTVESSHIQDFRKALFNDLEFRQSSTTFHEISEDFNKDVINKNDETTISEKLAKAILSKEELLVKDFEDCHVTLKTEIFREIPGKEPIAWYKLNYKLMKLTKFKDLKKSLQNELKKVLKKEKFTIKDMEETRFKIAEDFGHAKLSNDEEVLSKLAKDLVEILKTKTELKASFSKNYNVALSNEVVDVVSKKFHDNFINDVNLSNSTRKFRRILVQILFEESSKDFSELLKLKLKASKGFLDNFNPSKVCHITEPEEFAQQIFNLIKHSDSKKIVVNRKTAKEVAKVSHFYTQAFLDNICKIAGHVLIVKNKKIRFSSNFLSSENEKSQHLKLFHEKLKEIIKNNDLFETLFETLFEYEFEIDVKKFKTCEEEKLRRKLPKSPMKKDFEDFFGKLKIITSYPNRFELNNILEREIQEEFGKSVEAVFASIFQSRMYLWMASRIGTFWTKAKSREMFSDVMKKIANLMTDQFSQSYLASVPRSSVTTKDILSDFLEKPQKQILNISCSNLESARMLIVQNFQHFQTNQTRFEHFRSFTSENCYRFFKLSYLSSENVNFFKILEENSWNLILIEIDKMQNIESFQKLLNIWKGKKIIFLSLNNLGLDEIISVQLKHKLEIKALSVQFDNLTEENVKLFVTKNGI